MKKGVEFLGVILIILIAIALAGIVYGLISPYINKLNNIGSYCKVNDFFIIEEACSYKIDNYDILYIFLYRPLASELDQTYFLVKLFVDGKKINIAFDNRTFFEYYNGEIKNGSGKIEKGEGKSFIIILNPYNISHLNIKALAISMVGKKDNIEFSCGFTDEIKINECKGIKINNIGEINIENLENLKNNNKDQKILNLPW
ncbi:MAG: hypothetical protein QXQ30_00370 [Candidatus Pacearchaeota archaeon]